MQVKLMQQALEVLDKKIPAKLGPLQLLIGGGGAFSLAYQIAIQTADIDGVLFKSPIDSSDLDPFVKAVAQDLKISADWLNPYFGTFLMCLPPDYGDRLKKVFQGKTLTVYALGLTDLLIMKAFAGREKDMLHAKLLIRKGADLNQAEEHLKNLLEKKIPGAQEALDFLLEAEDQVGA